MNAAALELLDLGYPVIPLRPGSKIALLRDWQQRAPASQWQSAPENANIGIRGGGEIGAAVVDCDDLRAFENAQRYLAGLGYLPDGDYPLVQTASGKGRHAYTRLADALPGDYKQLRREFGKGELRYGPGAYVVGVGSVVDGARYELLAGDFRQLPRLERADLRELVDLDRDLAPELGAGSQTDIPLSRLATALLAGRNVERYPTRSEAEAALLAALVNAGYDFGGVLQLFLTHPGPGKFAELLREQNGMQKALRYLRFSYDKAASWARANESSGRKTARQAYSWALQRPWPGRTGNSDRSVFLAHVAIAFKAGRNEYAASIRDVAEAAGVHKDTAHKAVRRLLEDGLLAVEKTAVNTLAVRYRIASASLGHSLIDQSMRECPNDALAPAHDAFRHFGLGKTAAAVLQTL